MDRVIVYPGSVPMDTDMLRGGLYAKAGLGYLSQMLFGPTVTSAQGLVCTPSSSSLTLTVGVGSILAPGVMDTKSYGGVGGGLPADPTPTTCQYINPSAQSVSVPGTGATYTVFAVCSETDTDQIVMPFYNAANPTQTQAGVGNSGTALPTRRSGQMSFVVATSAPPTPAGGSVVALYSFALSAGATSLAGVSVQAGQVFWPTIPQLATNTLLQAAVTPQQVLTANGMISVPAWASRVELRAIGGGGGGASSSATSPSDGAFSGSGGGAGGDAYGVYSVSSLTSGGLNVTVGVGGASAQAGSTTLVTYNGATLLQANGGSAGDFYNSQGSAGGEGGAASGGTMWNLAGASGGDGQSSTATFAGYGGCGPWGGGGRCGNSGGRPGTSFGAGGGGSYSSSANGTSFPGGAGFGGCVLYRFLP